MPLVVRPLRYEAESRQLVDTLQANLPHLPHARLFEWLYLRNPEGRASVWVAADSGDSTLLGVAAAFPRRVYSPGGEAKAYVLGDFCIDSSQRSLGLALSLQRGCLEGLSHDEPAFAVDFPSQTMLAVYKRMRIAPNAEMIRFAKPLRADRAVKRRLPVPGLALAVAGVANAGLRLRDARLGGAGSIQIAAEAGPWGDEFTNAAHAWSTRFGSCMARTAPYLNWRYREHPLQSYEMFTARDGDRLRGYLILHLHGDDCTVDDLFTDGDDATRALVAYVVSLSRRRGVHTLSAPLLSTHPSRLVLESLGFSAREGSPVILMKLPLNTGGMPSASDWYLTHGDWES